MKRTRRNIFNTLTVVSLLLLLGVVGLWVDGLWYEVNLGTDYGSKKGDWSFEFISSQGAVGLNFFHLLEDFDPPLPTEPWQHKRKAATSEWLPGFRIMWPESSPMVDFYFLQIPYWFLTLIFAVLPAIWLFKWRKRRKFGPNACPACGYDLTGNESGVCPECGAKSAKTTSDSA